MQGFYNGCGAKAAQSDAHVVVLIPYWLLCSGNISSPDELCWTCTAIRWRFWTSRDATPARAGFKKNCMPDVVQRLSKLWRGQQRPYRRLRSVEHFERNAVQHSKISCHAQHTCVGRQVVPAVRLPRVRCPAQAASVREVAQVAPGVVLASGHAGGPRPVGHDVQVPVQQHHGADRCQCVSRLSSRPAPCHDVRQTGRQSDAGRDPLIGGGMHRAK